jgi:diguanylate cyclase (GGDEF)-like protein
MADQDLILIVDDEPINLDLLETELNRGGFQVARAEDGVQALTLARQLEPALVVTDILMPNMDGYQFCREVTSDPRLCGIPVVFYSATYTDPEDLDLAFSLGAARFIVKPSEPEVILEAITEVLDERRRGSRSQPVAVLPDESTFLFQYNKRLVAKLEKKIGDLDSSSRVLAEQASRAELAEDEIRRLAYIDSMTGLPTRISLLEHLRNRASSVEGLDTPYGLLYVDVDSFREINYAIGHDKGNLLLRAIAGRIAETALEPVSKVARIGGHDFAVVVDGVADVDRLVKVAERICDAFDRPFDIDGLTVDVTVSVGIAVSPLHTDRAELLLRHAAVALRDARSSRGLIAVYDPDGDPFEPGRVRLISGIRQAIRDDRLVVHYQPKILLSEGVTVGLEALVRWDHPELGLLEPGAFIGLAEQTGLVKPLGRWLFKHVLQQQNQLRVEGRDLEFSINMSTRNLMDSTLPDQFMEEVAVQGLDRPRVTLEITENSILKDPEQARLTLGRLSNLGVEVAIDDFGTGFSSLSHLKLLPVRELKIDRSFIMDMVGQEKDVQIVRSIIDLAHGLGMRVTAEGVESEGSLRRLAMLGCDRAQGFHMARPMPFPDLRAWLSESPWAGGV